MTEMWRQTYVINIYNKNFVDYFDPVYSENHKAALKLLIIFFNLRS